VSLVFARYRALRHIGALAVGVALAACRTSDSSVTISGDVPGLDTIALRGDSLIANAGKLPSARDTLEAVVNGKLVRPRGAANSASGTAVGTSTTPIALPGANAMTARAQARGDSMARAEAAKLLGASGNGRARGDTIRGVVTLVGQEPVRQAALTLPNGTTISLSGMATTGMTRLAGTEIVIRGLRISPRDAVVSDFIVRAVNGAPAYDGKLEGSAGSWSLQLTDGSGRKRLASVPAALQSKVGLRVWISSTPGTTGAPGYGIITR
jgi:hypothetical protein